METENITPIFHIQLYERPTTLRSPTLGYLQRETGWWPRSLAAGMRACSSPASCPTVGCVLISSHQTTHVYLCKQEIIVSCECGVSHLLHTTLWKICQDGITALICKTWSAFSKVRTAVVNEIILLIIRNKHKDIKFTLNSGQCNILCGSPEERHLLHWHFYSTHFVL